MKKILLLLFLLPCISFARLPEGGVADSFINELRTAKYEKDDTNRVLLLNAIAQSCFAEGRGDEGNKYAAQSLQLAERSGYKYGLGINYLQHPIASGLINYIPDLNNCFKALKIFEELKNDRKIAEALRAIGGIYYNMEKYPQALEYFEKQKKVNENIHDSLSVAAADHSIGSTYQQMGLFDQALKYELSALNYFERTGNNARGIAVVANLGNSYSSLRQYNKALVYSFRALRAYDSASAAPYFRGTARHDIGYIYFNRYRDTTSAMIADSLVPAGRAANLALALKYLKGANDIFERTSFTPLFGLLRYSDALTAAGQYGDALKIYKRYAHLKDSTLSGSVELSISKQETKREVYLNALTTRQKRTERMFFATGLALLIIIMGVLYRSYKIQRRANTIQEESLQQKDMLMKEIHHRVKNNLQVISTLLDLQLGSINDAAAKKAVAEGMGRIRSMSLIHQQLYQGEDISQVEFSKFSADLLQQTRQIFKMAGREISFVNGIKETFFDIDTAVPLGLILNELMTNSYKYAFGDGGHGCISISLDHEDDHYRLTYKDSGPGLPEINDKKSANTLGMMVVKSLSKQLRGAFHYIKDRKEFVVTFKDTAERKKYE